MAALEPGVLQRRFHTGCPTMSDVPSNCSTTFIKRSFAQMFWNAWTRVQCTRHRNHFQYKSPCYLISAHTAGCRAKPQLKHDSLQRSHAFSHQKGNYQTSQNNINRNQDTFGSLPSLCRIMLAPGNSASIIVSRFSYPYSLYKPTEIPYITYCHTG